MDRPVISEREFVLAVERAFQHLRARPLVLSPEDLERVLDWHRRNIPLSLVLEVMESVFRQAAQRRSRGGPRSLAYCAPAIDDAFAELEEGRVGRRNEAPSLDPEIPDLLARAAGALRASRAPAEAGEAAAARLEAWCPEDAGGESDFLAELEEELLAACLATLEPAERDTLEEAAREELAAYADGMEPEVLAHAIARARARMLRERFAVPELTLLPLIAG